MYTLRLFGGLTLEGPSGRYGGRIAQPRQLALLTLLAAAPRPGGCRRARILGYLWPEADEERARHLLSDTLYLIHRELGAESVLVSGQDLCLNRDVVSVDVTDFEEALEAAELEAAVDGYAGPFLDGFHVSGMPEFERWVDAQRGRHARSYAGALEDLAVQAEEEGDPRGAVDWWRRLVAHDPYSSRVTLRLMEALVRLGDHAAALKEAGTHERILQDDLDLEPAPEVAAMVERLRVEPPSVPPGRVDDVPAVSQTSVRTGRAGWDPAPSGAASPWRFRWRFVAVAGVLVAAAAVAAGVLVRGEGTAVDPGLVVVDVLANQTGDSVLDPLGAMAGHWLVQSLHASGLRVVPFDVSLANIGRGSAASTSGLNRLERLARVSGARIVVSGSYYREGDRVRLQAEISDAARGEVLYAPAPVNAPLDSPSLAFEPLRGDVRDFLFRYLNPAVVLDTLPGWIAPPAFEAYRRFLVGMEYFVDSDWAAATPHFEQAARLDSLYPPFLYMSAIALRNQGRNREAGAWVERLDGLDERMTAYDRATTDWMRAERPVEKLRAARRMADVGPSYVGYYLVAAHELELNRPEEALEILARPGVGDMLAPDWPPYWGVRLQALHSLGRHEEELEAARRGQQLHPAAPSLVGADLKALAALGRTDEVLERSEKLLGMGPAGLRPFITVGDELEAHGYGTSAATMWGRLAERLRVGAPGGMEGMDDSGSPRQVILIELLERLGRNGEARRLVDMLVYSDSLVFMEHLGLLAARRGDRGRAEAALSWIATRPDEYLDGRHLHAGVRIAAELGDAERAIGLLRRALAVSGAYGSLHRDQGLRGMRDHPGFRELVEPVG